MPDQRRITFEVEWLPPDDFDWSRDWRDHPIFEALADLVHSDLSAELGDPMTTASSG